MKCRACQHSLTHCFVDLNDAPPSNNYVKAQHFNESQTYFPLKVFVCDACFLVQIDEFESHATIFNSDYAYFSSFSTSWLKHCETYVDAISRDLNLNASSSVVEIASNDGYLLQYFLNKSIPCLGVEPTNSTANEARKKGIDVVEDFFTQGLAEKLATAKKADLIIANNVFAHVPDVIDFTKGLKALLSPEGTATIEFPHLLQLIKYNQFDTIYHEHFSYFSLLAIMNFIEPIGLSVYKVEQLPTHGGSLRIYIKHTDYAMKIDQSVAELLFMEKNYGLGTIECYDNFQGKVEKIKNELLSFLIACKNEGKKVAGYGAAAKGNTLLNYAGVHQDLVSFIVDASPHKQGKLSPGSKIPIVNIDKMIAEKPDVILIFPWNIQTEIENYLNTINDWGATYWVSIPTLNQVNKHDINTRDSKNITTC